MPFTGNTYTPPAGATSAAAGQIIASATWNAIFTDISTALTQLGKINVKTYGATGDGVTDDSTAIQAALTAAAASNGVVWIPSGTYVAHGLTIPANVSVQGESRSGVTLVPNGNSQTIISQVFGGVTASLSEITNLTIDAGTRTGTVGVALTFAYGTVIKGCNFAGCFTNIVIDRGRFNFILDVKSHDNATQGRGQLKIYSSDDAFYSFDIIVSDYEDVTLIGGFYPQQTPIYIRRVVSSFFSNISIGAMNSVAGKYGMIVENDCQGISFSNIFFLQAGEAGLLLQQGAGVVAGPAFCVFDNVSSDQCVNYGLRITKGTNNRFNNMAHTASKTAVSVEGTGSVWNSFSSVTIQTMSVAGFNVSGGAIENIISGSTIIACLTGFNLDSLTGVDVSGCMLSANTTSFTFVGTSQLFCTIRDNQSYDATLTSGTVPAGFWNNDVINTGNLNTNTPMTALNRTTIPAGGTAGKGYLLSSTANFGIFFGSSAPTLSAAKGSLYLRSDGTGVNDRAYINTNGSTTWTAITTVA